MPKYKVSAEGNNFQIDVDNVVQKCGFFTTRFVEADNPTLAEQYTINLIRDELDGLVLNEQKDSPTIYIEQIDEIQTFEDNQVPGTGFTWFKED